MNAFPVFIPMKKSINLLFVYKPAKLKPLFTLLRKKIKIEMRRRTLKVLDKVFFKIYRCFEKRDLAMNGNVIATIIAILNILWIIPIGYFMVRDIISK